MIVGLLVTLTLFSVSGVVRGRVVHGDRGPDAVGARRRRRGGRGERRSHHRRGLKLLYKAGGDHGVFKKSSPEKSPIII